MIDQIPSAVAAWFSQTWLRFEWPWLALCAATGLALAWALWSRTLQPWRAMISDPDLYAHLVGEDAPAQRRWLPALLWWGLWGLCCVALLGPAREGKQTHYRAEFARVVVVDLSESMRLQDLQPSRLAAAQRELIDALPRLQTGRTALIVYAHYPYLIAPLTDDVVTLRDMIYHLDTNLAPVQGSDTGAALSKALQVLNEAGGGDILLLSDSVPNAAAYSVAETLAANGGRLGVLGVGLPQGEQPLPVTALRGLAKAGGGAFALSGPGESDLDSVLFNERNRDGVQDASAAHDGKQDMGPWWLVLTLPLWLWLLRPLRQRGRAAS